MTIDVSSGFGRTLSPGHVRGLPATPDSTDVAAWLERNGIPRHRFTLLGPSRRADVARAMSDAHACAFASRAESGTNLFATQCLAMGLPTVLTRHTGHEDLARVADAAADGVAGSAESLAVSVERRAGSTPLGPWVGTEGWGEGDPREVAEALVRLRADRVAGAGAYAATAWADRADRGVRVATREAVVRTFSWRRMAVGLMREAREATDGEGRAGAPAAGGEHRDVTSRKKKRRKKK